MVDEVVQTGEHVEAIDNHQVAELFRGIDGDLLKGRLLLVQLFRDFEREGRTAFIADFCCPVVVIEPGSGPWCSGGGQYKIGIVVLKQ